MGSPVNDLKYDGRILRVCWCFSSKNITETTLNKRLKCIKRKRKRDRSCSQQQYNKTCFCMEDKIYLQFQMNSKWWQTCGLRTRNMVWDKTCLRDGGYFLVWLKMFFSDSLRRSSWEKAMTGMSTGKSDGHGAWGLGLNRVVSLPLCLYPFIWRIYCRTVMKTTCLHTG